MARIRGLEGDAARCYARLTARTPAAFHVASLTVPRVANPVPALAELESLELVDRLVPWSWRARLLPARTLRAAAAGLGLSARGRKQELVERLENEKNWHPGHWVRPRHRGLLRRLASWAFLDTHADRRDLTVARLRGVRWVSYELTSGCGLWQTRTAWRHWSVLASSIGSTDALLEALDAGHHHGPGRLDLGRRLSRKVIADARVREPSEPAGARSMYERLVRGGHVSAWAVAVRIARTYEAQGQPETAVALLDRARHDASPDMRVAIERTGRRLARAAGTAWRPSPPRARARDRRIRLIRAPIGGRRPAYCVGDQALPVEEALKALIEQTGRRVLHAEGPLWNTISGLLLVELMFLPVPSALPMRRLSAPLDYGTSHFRERREHETGSLLEVLAKGGGASLLERNWRRHQGERITGVRWRRWSLDDLLAVVEGLPRGALAGIIEAAIHRGRQAFAGMPDLLVLPGPPARLESAWPSRLQTGLILAEVKGPSDSMRDAQIAWMHHLVRHGVAAELWSVTTTEP